jgi:hypothetical protein
LVTVKDYLYNELYFQSLFLSYYASALDTYSTVLSLKKSSSSLDEVTTPLNNTEEIEKADMVIKSSSLAIKKSLKAV